MDTFLDVVEKYFIFGLLGSQDFPLLSCLLIFLLLTEVCWQLQARKEPRQKRIRTKAGVVAVTLLSLGIVFFPAIVLLAKWAEETQIGLLHWLALPTWGSFAVGFLLFDSGTYLWYSLGKKLSWPGTAHMQSIPHAIGNKEAHSNYSAFFSCWDRMHRTMLLNIPQKEFNIGVPSCHHTEEQTWKNLLVLSFENQRGWQLPNGGVSEPKPYTNTKDDLLP